MRLSARIFGTILILSLVCTEAGLAQQTAGVSKPVPLAVSKGTPLYLELEKKVPIKHAGTPVRARVISPVYAFDRMVIPAGSEVEGQVAEVQPVAWRVRLRAILAGDFTPLRKGRVEFRELALQHGRRIPIRAVVTEEALSLVHLHATPESKESKTQVVSATWCEVEKDAKKRGREYLQDVKGPGRWQRLKAYALSKLPYHVQDLPAGMFLTAELESPLDFGTADDPPGEWAHPGSEIPRGSVVRARLLTPLDSRTARVGSSVKAVVTKPLLSPRYGVILPEGTLFEGAVTRARPARWLSRNGQLDFRIEGIEVPGAAVQETYGRLTGAEVNQASDLQLRRDRGLQGSSSRLHYFIPGIDAAQAATSAAGSGRAARATLEVASVGTNALVGTKRPSVSLGLVGSVITVAARSHAVVVGFTVYGAAWSVFANLLARGNDVVLPRDTPLEIRLAPPAPTGPARRPSSR